MVGAILPLTGNGADQGGWNRDALELARDQINADGGIHGVPLEIVFEDSKRGDVAQATLAYQSLKTRGPMPAVLSWGSGVGIALTNLVNDDRVIQMGIATSSPAYSTPGDFTFRTFPSGSAEGAFSAGLVFNRLGAREVSILFVQNDYGLANKTAFREKFEELGGRVLSEESVAAGTLDAKSELTKIKNSGASVVFLAVYPQEGAIILQQANDLGLSPQFIASNAIQSGAEFFEVAGDSAEGLLVTVGKFDPDSPDEATQELVRAYAEKYARTPTAYDARAFDGLNVIVRAMRACDDPMDTECVRQKLASTRDYPGAAGVITFDEFGDIQADFQILQVKSRQFVPYAK